MFSELKNMEKTWKYFDENPSGKKGDSSRAWNKLFGRLEKDGLLEHPSVLSGNRQILPALKVAASILSNSGYWNPGHLLWVHP